VTQFAIS